MEKESKLSVISVGEEDHPVKSFLYFVSNYFWLLFFTLIVLYYQLVPHFQEVQIIKSLNQHESWESSYNPHIFGFISDVHTTTFYPQDAINAMSILEILNKTGVEKILIAGDISDNFATKSSIKHGQQYEEDFIIYQKIVAKYPSDFLIVASGNHDEFGVEKYNSSNHYILKYCNFYSKNDKYKYYDNFLISKVDHEDIEIFVMNPYHYPTIRAGLGYYSNLTREMLDTIEKTLSSPSNSKARFLLTHFPLSYSNTWVKSSSHKTLIDIATSNNITAVLTGHSHHELILHRKSTLEIRPRSIKSGKDSGLGYRYVAIDNGCLSDSGFVLKENEMPVAMLTYPSIKKYVNERTDFSFDTFKKAEIRVVHFSENQNLNVSVSCKSSSNKFSDVKTNFLKFQRIIRNGQSLYSTPLKQLCYRESDDENKVNEYHLTFSGDWNYEADFVSGESVKLENEILDYDVNMRECVVVIGAICWIIILFIWCPIPSFKYFDKIDSFFAGNANSTMNSSDINLCDELIGIIFGIFVIKSRIYHNIPKFVQNIYLFAVFSPLFLPVALMKIGDHSYGFIYFLGYYLNGFAFDLWGGQLTSYFILFVLLPSTLVFSSISFFKQTKKWNYFFLVDIAAFLSQFFLIFVAISRALYQSTSFLFALTSPFFGMFPIVIIYAEIKTISKLFVSFTQNNDKQKFLYDDNMYY